MGPEGSFDPKDLEDLVIELAGPVPDNIDKLINIEFADGGKPVVKTVVDAPKDIATAVKTKVGEIAAPQIPEATEKTTIHDPNPPKPAP